MPPSNIKDIHNPHPLYLTLLIEKAMHANSLIKTVYKFIFNKSIIFFFKYKPGPTKLIIKRTRR